MFSYPADKNPDYEYNSNDRWGNYKPSANALNSNPGGLNNADYPYSIQDKAKADKYAASWVMDKILLPSGGVINVDFESDDYGYVQDRKAANMCKILGFGVKSNPVGAEQTNPYLFPSKGKGDECNYIYIQLSYAITSTDINEQQRELAARYFENKVQLFMKLAVKMPSTPGIAGSELIPVYADIDNFGIVPGSGGAIAYVKVKTVSGGSTPMVQQALQFIKQQLPGKAYPGYDVKDDKTAKAIVIALAGMITSVAALKMGEDPTLKFNNKCREVETAKSFVRLTNPYLKKYGGGLRVKKVTINDNWNKMTGQYESNYGQEYKYTTNELINGRLTTISSGVVSWEPSMGGDENPHKEIMRYMNHNRGGPYDFGVIEMPLGEMFYPSPTVGYSNVEVLSIHRDTVKNLPTRQVTEFYTTKDFPFRSSCTQLSDPEANVKYEPRPLLQLLNLNMKKSITQSQGFLVDMNDMNGKVKIQATYSALDAVNAVSFTQNFYNIQTATDKTYKFNHRFSTISNPNGVVDNNSLIGRDIELMADFRQHKTETITTNISVNFDFFFLGIFPIPLTNLLQPTIYEGTTYRSAALLKIVNHYGILDSVVVIDKGSMVSTKNMIYDAETGNPILTRTNNEHNKPVYNFSYPAHWAYSGMGPAYKNIDANYSGLTFRNGKLETPISMNIFESGDELYVIAKNDKGPDFQYPCDGTASGRLPKNNENKIWAVNTAKGGSLTPQFVFIDKFGNPYTATDVKMRVVRSGHRNMLDQTVGNITSLKSPVNEITGQLEFIDATNIIQTSAATFKDHWKVDNSWYNFDSTRIVNVSARIKLMTFNLSRSAQVEAEVDNGKVIGLENPILNSKSLTVRSVSYNKKEGHNYDAWIDFNMRGNLPSGLANPSVNIIKSRLSLFSHTKYNWAPYSNESYIHEYQSYGTNHTSDWSHLKRAGGGLNDLAVLGMHYPWPSNNLEWETLYKDEKKLLHNWQDVGYVPPTIDFSGINYEFSTAANDTRIPIPTTVMQSMLVDARNTNSNLVTGFRLMQMRKNPGDEKANRKEDLSQCFMGSALNFSGKSIKIPLISVYYFNCGDLSYSTITDNDPLVNQVIQCGQVAETFSFCRSRFTKKAINPYVEGILGNWRVDTAFVYYGERKEQDAGVGVDTRTAGTIINFQKFWNPDPNYLKRNTGASAVWVWNSTITQYNRKGYEIENKDPLGRFNSGLYGYNQQLPVAVANNARVREIMFDGFEDYDYQTAFDCISCKPHRHSNFGNINASLDTSQKHTGRYSLRVEGGKVVDLKAPVTDTIKANQGYGLRIKIDSTSYQTTVINKRGTGLTAKYLKYTATNKNSSMMINANTALNNLNNSSYITRIDKEVNLGQSPGMYNPPLAVGWGNFVARWEGYLQAPTSGNYLFKVFNNDCIRLWIKGNLIVNNWVPGKLGFGSSTISLTQGEVCSIKIDYVDTHSGGQAQLLWQEPNSQSYSIVPTNVLYSLNDYSLTQGNVLTNTVWCTKLDTVQVRGNAITDTFSLIQSKKMILSTWVKEVQSGADNCKCSTYVKSGIVISYTGSSQTENLLPTGNIIEGWQRFESVFTVPATATEIKVSLKNTNASNGDTAYFDDLRIHPFNAKLKSFVYHSSNLRLMAELDENNYASFYEYDDDGTLTRVKKETINGIKTITETRSAMQKAIKSLQ